MSNESKTDRPKPTKAEVMELTFARLSATWGQAFMRQFDGIEANAVKSVWLFELDGFLSTDEGRGCMRWALRNLPERPLNAVAFRNLCRQAPRDQMALPAPDAKPASPEVTAMVRNAMRKPKPATDGRGWARAIIARFERGEKIASATLGMARSALRMEA